MGRVILFVVVISILSCSQEKSEYYDYPISKVNIQNVVLTDSFWLPKIDLIQDTTIYYAFKKCEEEGRMENFLIAGKKMEGTTRGKMPFDDTDLYKIIEGASYSLISKPNSKLETYIDSVISVIKIGQEPDGYITTWFTIDRQKPPAPWVKPSTERWENEISSHELYNSGHLFEAAAAHYRATGKTNFLDIALKNADLLVNNFGPNKLRIPPGHEIVETGLIKLSQITNSQKYLQLAKFFLDERGDSSGHNLFGAYNQDHIPVIKQTEAVGHAVRALYMYAGMADIAAIYKDTDYLNAVYNLWENVTNKKMYITGGVGSKHDGEAFGDNYELPNLTAYNETCAAIGNIYWNYRLFQLTGNSKYVDVLERALYNGMIAGISLDEKKYFYPNPTESDGEYKFNKGSCTREEWFDCSCCPTNLIRFIPSIPELIYSTDKDSLYINLFISNKANLKVAGNEIKIEQKTNYPWEGKMEFVITSEIKKNFEVKIRIPGWSQNKPISGDLYSYLNGFKHVISIFVNGEEIELKQNKGYAVISREWNTGDKIELNLPMVVKKVIANPMVKDDSNKVAFECGPIVYCAEEIDNKNIENIKIPDNIDLSIEQSVILNEKINEMKGKVNQSEFTLIPYYIWSNRGIGKMKVWFARN